MSSNRVGLLVVGIALLLIVVFVLSSRFPLGEIGEAEEVGPSAAAVDVAVESAGDAGDGGDAAGSGGDSADEPEAAEQMVSEAGTSGDGADQSAATDDASPEQASTQENATQENSTQETATLVKQYTFNVINSYPHDPNAFTQGLIWYEDGFYEGTGLRGRSSLRKVNLADGQVTQQHNLAEQFFGEGITIFGDRIYQITWQSQTGFVYARESFEQLFTFSYPTEGWGLTHDGEQLIMSDGTPQIYYLDPMTLEQTRSILVTRRGQPQRMLNELEYINGLIYANVWQTDEIVMIDPDTGVVQGEIDLTGLLEIPDAHSQPVDVLNGIAYDSQTDRLYVTGKLWPQLYEIELVELN